MLANNIPAYQLVVTPANIPDLKQSILDLQRKIPISQDDINAFYKRLHMYRSNQSIPLVNSLSETQVAQFYVDQYQFPGINVQIHMIRHYPFGASMANVLGYVGRINDQDLQNIDHENYSASTFIG